MSTVSDPRFKGIDFERSYLLGVIYDDESLTLEMDFRLSETHPEYVAPQAGEEGCYRGGFIRFADIEDLQIDKAKPVEGEEADYVSKADQASERTLWDELRAARPDWGFVLEEGGVIEGDPAKPRWIIDPLDGTSNFLHGIPHFAISIAAQEPKADGSGWGDVVAGVVYQPISDDTFWAEKNRGAWLQDARLRVSGRRSLSEALIATGIPYQGHGDFEEWSKILAAVGPEVAGIRRFGSAALDLAWLAAGRYDGV